MSREYTFYTKCVGFYCSTLFLVFHCEQERFWRFFIQKTTTHLINLIN